MIESLVIGHPSVFTTIGLPFSNVKFPEFVIPVGIIKIPIPEFNAGQSKKQILVKKLAFSCNFRDITACEGIYKACLLKSTPNNFLYSGFGSEFVAEVLAVGEEVGRFKVGDRVISDAFYPLGRQRTSPGLPSNYASERVVILDEEQLLPIPNSLSNAQAASLTVAGQTAYSMIRRSELISESSVLITAGSSNTSMFTVSAIRRKFPNIKITGVTSSNTKHSKLLTLGYDTVLVNDDDQNFRKELMESGPYDVVIDPFFDLNLHWVVEHMNFFGKYLTCGFYRQNKSFESNKLEGRISPMVFQHAIVKNLSFVGNCLGNTQDLEQAIQDVSNGVVSLIIDKEFGKNSYPDFIDRSFFAADRFGKVVYNYQDE